jgi:polyferredoxin
LKAASNARPSRLGIIVAALYVFLVLVVYAITASSKPSGLGYEWIPFIFLAMPWTLMGERLPILIFGFLVNTGILYLFGALIEKFLRRTFRKS